MVERADHRGGIEGAIDERQTVDVCGHIDVFVRRAEPGLCLLQLGAGIIEEHDTFEAEVAGGITSRARAQLEQEAPASREQALEGNGLRAVFILAPAPLPE